MRTMKRTVLVTGGAGYIGSHTCKELSRHGYWPIVYDNLSEGHSEFVRWGELVEGDVRDGGKLLAVFNKFQPMAVIHFAASAYVGDSMDDPQSYYDNNVSGSLSLLSAMQSAGCKSLVFSSTCAVYGEAESVPIGANAATKPVSPYGRSKLMVEQVLQDLAATGSINSIALRYFNAAGADPDGEIGERHEPEPHLIPNAIQAGLGKRSSLQVFGNDYPTKDGTCVRDYIHVTDLAKGHVAALDYLLHHNGHSVFNLGAGQGVSVGDVIVEIEQQLGVELPVIYQPRRAGDPAELIANIAVSQAGLDWSPNNSNLTHIISTAIAWAKSESQE